MAIKNEIALTPIKIKTPFFNCGISTEGIEKSKKFRSVSKNKFDIDVIEYEDGSIYTGETSDQKKNGFGVLQNSKQFYEGEFLNDNFSGFGYVESIKKIAYTGEFLNNVKHGIGIQFSLEDSYYYEGEWKDNHKNGVGKEILPDKSEYIGYFYLGKKHGVGIYKMSNGRKYEGEFSNSKINGYVSFFLNKKLKNFFCGIKNLKGLFGV